MNIIYLSNGVHPVLCSYLEKLGYPTKKILESPFLPNGIASHPDLFMCKMGSGPESPVFLGNPSKPKAPYPGDVSYNAVCTGKYFIHCLSATDDELMQKAIDRNLELINVRQGYTKCNMVVVDENSFITSDRGIFDALSLRSDIECLLIQPGHVQLKGYPTGFIGGATGRVGNRILFHGNLKAHPNSSQIGDFIEKRGLEVVWFDEFPLTDIGSIIESNGYIK